MSLSKFSGVFNAFDYAYGVNPQVPALQVIAGSNAGGTYSVTLAFGKVFAADGRAIVPVAGVPIGIGANSSYEVITPSAVSNPTPNVYGTCIITGTFTNAHSMGDQVVSGDGGLQEAVTSAIAYGGGLVALDARFGQAVGVADTVAALTTYLATFNSLSAAVSLLDWRGVTLAKSYHAATSSAYAAVTTIT
jgi:hypothetical protein